MKVHEAPTPASTPAPAPAPAPVFPAKPHEIRVHESPPGETDPGKEPFSPRAAGPPPPTDGKPESFEVFTPPPEPTETSEPIDTPAGWNEIIDRPQPVEIPADPQEAAGEPGPFASSDDTNEYVHWPEAPDGSEIPPDSADEPAAREPAASSTLPVTESLPPVGPRSIEESEQSTPPSMPPVIEEEEYRDVYDQIEVFIAEISLVIRTGDFYRWRTFLTDEYLAFYSDPVELALISDSPTLSHQGIRLRTLKDYFDSVVVPSRAHVRLVEIEFIDRQSIRAYTIFNELPVRLYNLRRENDGWKIAVE